MLKQLAWFLFLIQISLVFHPTGSQTLTEAAVSNEQLTLMEEVSKLAGISYCNEIKPPFDCKLWCSDFENTTLIQKFTTNDFTEVHGYIARDDNSKRVIISVRGTEGFSNAVIDMILFLSPGKLIAGCPECRIHSGFYLAWQSVEKAIALPVAEQLAQYPDYQLLITGHSMGGALATLLGLSYQNLGKSPLVITFGQPRVGNPAFANFVDTVFSPLSSPDSQKLVNSSSLMRVTHGNDPVAHIPFQDWGYKHHGGEYWINKKRENMTITADDITHCQHGEDPACLEGQPFNPLDANDHDTYFRDINPKGKC